MKLVTAIIRPFKLEDVRRALSEVGVSGLTVTEVKGFGRQKGHTELYRGADYVVDLLPKVRLEVAIETDILDRVVEAIAMAAKTDKIGDGKIFVHELEQAIRIRTGETGKNALRGSRETFERRNRNETFEAEEELCADVGATGGPGANTGHRRGSADARLR